jgi:type I site-specific restriction endonuclease
MENKITLRPYQQAIVEKTCKLLRDAPRFAYLSMEVRTGKTLTALSALDCVGGVTTVLFVTKKKAIEGIKKDYNALAPSYKCDFINYESLHKVVDICYDAIVFERFSCTRLLQWHPREDHGRG